MSRKHKVSKGDTISGIAKKYNVSIEDLLKANNIKDANKIRLDLELVIPYAVWDLIGPNLHTESPNITILKPTILVLKPVLAKRVNLWENPDYFNRQMYVESKYDPTAKSQAGAIGLMQIMPKTYLDYVRITGEDGDLTDPVYNIKVGKFRLNQIGKMPYVNAVGTTGTVSDINRAAKVYGGYNAGPGNMIDELERLKKAGYDIYNDTSWIYLVENKEMRDYIIHNLALNDDVYLTKYAVSKPFNKYAISTYRYGGIVNYLDYIK